MDASTLAQAMGNSVPLAEYERLLPTMLSAMRVASINTVNRAAMWCAQIGHESGGLRYMEEIASGAAYEGRSDLGNVYPGDGVRYKGRGPIQLTGRNNYASFSKWCFNNGLVTENDHFFVDDPYQLEDPYWGFLAAAYYWVAARPQLNTLADNQDLEGATRAINGGLNNLNDRSQRYNRCLALGSRLLPDGGQPMEKRILDYSRVYVVQETYYNCGPASCQNVINGATGQVVAESELGRQLGTTENGTNWIGSFPEVLNRYMPDAQYRHEEMPHDPATDDEKENLWRNLTKSINSGYGVVANIVAPPSNYPRASYESDMSLNYGGGTVFHYISIMGYVVEDSGERHVWLADSGFPPYGCWITFDQLATLIPPKGYAYANCGGDNIVVSQDVRDAALNDAKIAAQNTENEVKAIKAMVERILTYTILVSDQLNGPEKDSETGLPTFTGWKPNGDFEGTDGKTLVAYLTSRLNKKENK